MRDDSRKSSLSRKEKAQQQCQWHAPLPESLKLWTAYVDVGGLKQNPDTVTPQLSKSLGPEQAAIAINKGHALVAAARGTK